MPGSCQHLLPLLLDLVGVPLLLQAKQLEKDLRNGSGAEAEQRFVWGKKIEKQIQEGKGIDDLGPEAERRRREERLVSLIKRRQ